MTPDTLTRESAATGVTPGGHTYTLRRTKGGSDRYGPCEVCGRHCDTTYHQVAYRAYLNHHGRLSWTRHRCSDLFGHRGCLERRRSD